MENILNENNVIDHVVIKLKQRGFEITHKSYTRKKGFDIKAKKGDKILYVEAKGETSSKPDSKRFGEPFDSSQKEKHLAEAIYKAMEALSLSEPDKKVISAIALPDDKRHKELVEKVKGPLNKLGIVIIFVKHDGKLEFNPKKALSF